MSYSIAAAIRRLIAPQHELSCSWLLWRRLIGVLRERGQNGSRESGAFLLGHREGGAARIVDFVAYDDLDPQSLVSGIVDFDGRHYAALWAKCEAKGVEVVADVHVHPAAAGQSQSDQDNPMIPKPGHIALIIPNFAKGRVFTSILGIYRYRGSKQWSSIPPRARSAFFHIGI